MTFSWTPERTVSYLQRNGRMIEYCIYQVVVIPFRPPPPCRCLEKFELIEYSTIKIISLVISWLHEFLLSVQVELITNTPTILDITR